jgi:hypothetical protein
MADSDTTDSDTTEKALAGIDRERVTEWMVANTEPVEPPLDFELIAGGRSNLTFRVTDAAGRRWCCADRR